jgi:signal transduction histidine kinase
LEHRDVPGALQDLARRMTSGTLLQAEVRVTGTPRPLPATVEHHLLRIGVDALTNAIKHSGARRIDIEVRFGAESTDLVVSDDGHGFAQPAADASGEHFGLRGIRERVDKLGAALALDSGVEGGTRLAVRVPVGAPGAGTVDQGVSGG